jgi:hypothetical protein
MMNDHIEIIHMPAKWAKKAKEIEFLNDEQITALRIKQKLVNMKRVYVRIRTQYQDATGFGVTEEDCSPSIAGK